MTTPPTDEQLREWEQGTVEENFFKWIQPGIVNRLIQEVRRLRGWKDGYRHENARIADEAIRRAEKAEAELERLRSRNGAFLDEVDELRADRDDLLERARKAEAERDGLRDELTVALAKATDLMAERDRYKRLAEDAQTEVGKLRARAALDQPQEARHRERLREVEHE